MGGLYAAFSQLDVVIVKIRIVSTLFATTGSRALFAGWFHVLNKNTFDENGRYSGTISWKGTTASGTCTPAKCTVKNSNMLAGSKCACKDG